MSKILLHTPEGVRDIYGQEYAKKLYLEQRIHEQIAAYGYQDIQTPTFEFFDVFSRQIGTTPSKELYKFFDKEGNTLVLRPDFTPSIARCVAKYFMEEEVPIRFTYLGNTFINTSNLQGKLKEVTQIGAELINDDSVEADAELIAMVIRSLQSTGLHDFQLSIGQVEFFKGLCEEAGLDSETESDLREYISGKNIFAAEDLLMGKNVPEPYKSTLLKVGDMYGDLESIREIREMVSNRRSIQAIDRLEAIYDVLKLYGVLEYVSFDLGMLSKYHYYTGIIFKAYTYGVGGAIVKGGRYNGLLQQFGKASPAVGFALVIDDLLEALSRQKVEIPVLQRRRQIAYTAADYQERLKEANAYRAQGISVELVPERQ